jgi:hypothetical protein
MLIDSILSINVKFFDAALVMKMVGLRCPPGAMPRRKPARMAASRRASPIAAETGCPIEAAPSTVKFSDDNQDSDGAGGKRIGRFGRSPMPGPTPRGAPAFDVDRTRRIGAPPFPAAPASR